MTDEQTRRLFRGGGGARESDRSLFYDSRDMSASPPPPAKKRSEARERLLGAASQLFYAEGINSVGIERLIKEGHVSLASFYRHFPSKVDLVVAYLRGTHDDIAARAAEQAEQLQ